MPRLRWTEEASEDLVRLYEFLAPKSKDAATRAVRTILQRVRGLESFPEMGRPVEGMAPEFRELVVTFGAGAYVARYRVGGNVVLVLRVRHGREAGYLD